MKDSIKKGLLVYGLWVITLIIFIFIYTLFVSSGVLKMNYTRDISGFIFSIILFFILGGIAGNIHQNEGLKKGIIYSAILTLFLILFNFLGHDKGLRWDNIIRYIIYIVCSGFGGSFGVNMKPFIR